MVYKSIKRRGVTHYCDLFAKKGDLLVYFPLRKTKKWHKCTLLSFLVNQGMYTPLPPARPPLVPEKGPPQGTKFSDPLLFWPCPGMLLPQDLVEDSGANVWGHDVAKVHVVYVASIPKEKRTLSIKMGLKNLLNLFLTKLCTFPQPSLSQRTQFHKLFSVVFEVQNIMKDTWV